MQLLTQLKTMLLQENYKPGDKIPTESELATRFGVSRGKIREAATTLCQLGILDKKARRGTVVKSLDTDSVGDDLYFRFSLADINPADFVEARKVIEKAVIPLIVRRITPAQLQLLADQLTVMEHPGLPPEEIDRADREFHLILLKSCGNHTLQTFGQVIQALFAEEHRRRYWSPERFARAAADHRQLIAALKNSDEAAAIAIIANHFQE